MEPKGRPLDREDLGGPRDSPIPLGLVPITKLSPSAYATDSPCLCQVHLASDFKMRSPGLPVFWALLAP